MQGGGHVCSCFVNCFHVLLHHVDMIPADFQAGDHTSITPQLEMTSNTKGISKALPVLEQFMNSARLSDCLN